jgi:hypothetical protein
VAINLPLVGWNLPKTQMERKMNTRHLLGGVTKANRILLHVNSDSNVSVSYVKRVMGLIKDKMLETRDDEQEWQFWCNIFADLREKLIAAAPNHPYTQQIKPPGPEDCAAQIPPPPPTEYIFTKPCTRHMRP